MFLFWLTTVLFSVITGIILTLFIQFYLYKKYFSINECIGAELRLTNEPLSLPKVLEVIVRNEKISPNDSCMAVNLLLQFLFHEMRDTEKVRKWFWRKLTSEFEQLLSSSAIGRMIAHIKIREIHLGKEFPVLSNIGVQNVQINDNDPHIDTLDLKLDINYCGSFRLVIDVSLLGKAANVSVTVNELQGEGRLQFNRLPYSHWSFTFYNEPKLHLDVLSQFQGKAYQQITTLISNQIRRALRKKHTLPNYKLRYKPFFDFDPWDAKALQITPGQLQLTIHKVTRLNKTLASGREIYIVAGLDNLPWVEIRNYGSSNFIVLDIVIIKRSQAIGLHFKQDFVEEKDEYCIILDEIQIGGFHSDEELNVGDVILSVDGKKTHSVNQLNKLIKTVPEQFILRIERKVIKAKNDESSLGSSENISIVSSCPIYNSLRRRKGSESETCTPSSSLPGTPSRRNYFRSSLENNRFKNIAQHHCDELCQKLRKTRSMLYNQVLLFDEKFIFNVKSEERYLNINIRAMESDSQSDKLLGYLNIPLCHLEAADDYLIYMHLKPPDTFSTFSRNHELSSQNGFNPSLCFGDVVLSFQYTHSLSISNSPSVGRIPEIIESKLSTSESADSLHESTIVIHKKHNFVRTHFNTSTQCDFCGKKIWLKDAERCLECGMSCHRKCVMKCNSETVCSCTSSDPKLLDEEVGSGVLPPDTNDTSSCNVQDAEGVSQKGFIKPEITMTCAEEVTPQSTPKKTLGGLLANVATRSLKRVGSANNLVIPGSQGSSSQSKSLPPSPQQSPAPSRKPSLPSELSDEISSVLETLMQQGTNQGDLMDFAKESGKTLYEELNKSERKEKIHDMINKLKCAINSEVESRISLEKEEQNANDANAKAKIAFLIGKSDEKTQALTILMLHFCAGLQHIQDLEEQEKEIDVNSESVQNASRLP